MVIDHGIVGGDQTSVEPEIRISLTTHMLVLCVSIPKLSQSFPSLPAPTLLFPSFFKSFSFLPLSMKGELILCFESHYPQTFGNKQYNVLNSKISSRKLHLRMSSDGQG